MKEKWDWTLDLFWFSYACWKCMCVDSLQNYIIPTLLLTTDCRAVQKVQKNSCVLMVVRSLIHMQSHAISENGCPIKISNRITPAYLTLNPSRVLYSRVVHPENLIQKCVQGHQSAWNGNSQRPSLPKSSTFSIFTCPLDHKFKKLQFGDWLGFKNCILWLWKKKGVEDLDGLAEASLRQLSQVPELKKPQHFCSS